MNGREAHSVVARSIALFISLATLAALVPNADATVPIDYEACRDPMTNPLGRLGEPGNCRLAVRHSDSETKVTFPVNTVEGHTVGFDHDVFVATPCRGDADRVCYRVNVTFVADAFRRPIIKREGEIPLALLPRTAGPVPSGPPTPGPDGDGDGLPAYVDIPLAMLTINRDGTLTFDPLTPVRVPMDPDDGRACPRVAVEDPRVDERPDGGARVTAEIVACTPDGMERRVPIDQSVPGPFPISIPDAPTGNVPAEDADGDGVPVVYVERGTFTIRGDGSFGYSDVRREPTGLLDPDDADPSNPGAPAPPSATVLLRAGCERDAICADASIRGTPVDRDESRRASLVPATDAAYGATGLRPVEIAPDAVIVHGAPPPGGATTPPVSQGIPAQRVAVGSAEVRTPCPGVATGTTPTVALTGVLNRHVISYPVRELPPIANVRCLVTGFLGDTVVPVPPVAVP